MRICPFPPQEGSFYAMHPKDATPAAARLCVEPLLLGSLTWYPDRSWTTSLRRARQPRAPALPDGRAAGSFRQASRPGSGLSNARFVAQSTTGFANRSESGRRHVDRRRVSRRPCSRPRILGCQHCPPLETFESLIAELLERCYKTRRDDGLLRYLAVSAGTPQCGFECWGSARATVAFRLRAAKTAGCIAPEPPSSGSNPLGLPTPARIYGLFSFVASSRGPVVGPSLLQAHRQPCHQAMNRDLMRALLPATE
jgi:hypothetical protein